LSLGRGEKNDREPQGKGDNSNERHITQITDVKQGQ
jgi:hypothetical protein